MVFLAFVGLFYFFDALWAFFKDARQFEKLAKFAWMCAGVTVCKILVKVAVWAVNL